MVHALKQVHRILQPNSLLINLQPLPLPYLIEVRSPATTIQIGRLTDQADTAQDQFAFDALDQVVEEGNFILEEEQNFDFHIHADDLNELQRWPSEWWGSAALPEEILERVESAIRKAGQQAEVVIIIPARMMKLVAV